MLFNFRFMISNTDHIIDVNKATSGVGHQHDQIDIVCPKYESGTPNEVRKQLLFDTIASLLRVLFPNCIYIQFFGLVCVYVAKSDLKCIFQTMERHVIYNVNKEEYDSCLITSSNPRIIAYCTEPTEKR